MKRVLRLASIGLLWVASAAWAASPLDYTRVKLKRAQAIVSADQAHNDKLAALSALFREFLDTDTMGREALGTHWSSFTPSQQKEFLTLFHSLFERTYVAKLLLFERPQFAYVSETAMDGKARVDTKIITPRDEFDVLYRLRSDGQRWMATEITVEDVSLTANLGSQMNDLLSRMSPAELLDLMRRKYGGKAGDAP